MPKRLTAEQVQDYESRGFACPVPVLTPAEVRDARAAIEAFEARTGRTLDYPEKSKSYLLFDWADRLIRHPAILDAVEDLIGPDILVYHTTMWIKDPGTPQYIAWHQDGTYFYLDPAEHVTAWVALSDASEEAGCMRVLPGTHRDDWHRVSYVADQLRPQATWQLQHQSPSWTRRDFDPAYADCGLVRQRTTTRSLNHYRGSSPTG